MPPPEPTPLNDLPQSRDNWSCTFRRLRLWIRDDEGEPYRPYVLLIVNRSLDLVLNYDLLERAPDTNAIRSALFEIMRKGRPDLGVIPARPRQVEFEDRELQKSMLPHLDEIGVRAKYGTQTALTDALIRDLEAYMTEGDPPQIPGLLRQPKVTAKMVGEFFDAAATFYRAEPWVQLGNSDPLAIRIPPQRDPWYIIVMGQGGIEYGLAVYPTLEDLSRNAGASGPPTAEQFPDGIRSLLFNTQIEVPFDDLDDIDKHGWELAADDAIPAPLIFLPPDEVKRPDRKEILWYEAALRAIPRFLADHAEFGPDGSLLPAEVDLTVKTYTGPVKVYVSYPVEGLTPMVSRRGATEADGDSPDFRSLRRSMESSLASISLGLGDKALAPEVYEAQDVMYEAWGESDPERRIELAREALSISADCADAYVLLAEEEAEQVTDALDLFEHGLAAGRRALGEDYFDENEGHFWGLLETRPYMRALEGKAGSLWQLNRRDDAIAVYRDMLRLNPNDNQGVRYLLTELYLDMNQDEDLAALLDEYEKDAAAAWLYSRALVEFRADGPSEKAGRSLQEAMEQNPYVPGYLTGAERIPGELTETIGFGDETEAVDYAVDHLNHWRRTPGALEWLKENLPEGGLPSASGASSRSMRRKAGEDGSGLQPGDSVIVNQGVDAPDSDTDLSGWQGWVETIYEGEGEIIVHILWDSQTLKAIDRAYIEESVEDGLDWTEMVLGIEDVQLAEPRDRPDDREAVIDELEDGLDWAIFGEEGRRIQAVLDTAEGEDEDSILGAWERHLREQLRYPFKAKYVGFEASGPMRPGSEVEVTGIAEVDEFYGVLVDVRAGRKKAVLPLVSLEVVGKGSGENHDRVEEYGTWFANR